MNNEAKKKLDQITNECARDIIENNDNIKEWVRSQNNNNPGKVITTIPTQNTGLKDTLTKKNSD